MVQPYYILFLWNIFLLMLITCCILTDAQENIFAFSPDQPHCIGEEVVLTCYVYPTARDYSNFALISFNGSTPESVGTINANTPSTGYTATGAILEMGNSARIELTITSFQVSDNNTLFGCYAEFSDNGTFTDLLESDYPPIAAPPSSSVVTLSLPDTNCINILISWNTPNSDRDITEYSVYRNNTLLTTTTDNQYTDTDQLTINTVYEYSVTAISCAGNSTGTNTLSIGGYSLTNTPQLFISYNNITSILTVDWTLLPVLTPPPLLLEYSLVLDYNHTQFDTTDQFSNSSTFSLLSSITVYDTYITPHDFSPADGVVTNITACIRITLQCGAFTGQTICRFYNSENPPLPPTPTASVTSVNVTTATPPADQVLPIIIGVVGAVGGILLILFIILFFIMLYICCIRNRGTASPKRSVPDDNIVLATTTNSDTQPDATYAQIHKPNTSATADLYSSVNKHRPAPYPDLTYAELDHVRSATDRVNPSSVPSTNYSDLAQLPRAEQTTYATVTDGPRQY